MILTNKHNLPENVFRWIQAFNEHNELKRQQSIEEYENLYTQKFNYKVSVTSLIKPIQESVLIDRYYDRMERDASEFFDAIMGVAVHDSFETMPKKERELREIRIGKPFKDVLVHGEFDSYFQGEINDYKTMKVSQYLWGDKEYEWVAQVSMYKNLFQACYPDLPVGDSGKITLIFTDWREKEHERKKYGFSAAPNYPQRSVEIPLTLWDKELTERFIMRRATDYRIASDLDNDQLPPCNDKERWAKESKGKISYVKCEKYCAAAKFCHQWGYQ